MHVPDGFLDVKTAVAGSTLAAAGVGAALAFARRRLPPRKAPLLGLAGLAERPPHRLRCGEKRRACLAGVLACRASVLALDEPESGLDLRGRRALIGILRGLPAAQPVATHDLELVLAVCPRVVVLDAGAIVADGPSAEILGDEALMLAHGLERPTSLGQLGYDPIFPPRGVESGGTPGRLGK